MMKGVPSLTAAGLYVLCKSFIKSNEERQGLKVSFLMEHPLVLQYTPCKPYWKRSFFSSQRCSKANLGDPLQIAPYERQGFYIPPKLRGNHSLPFTPATSYSRSGEYGKTVFDLHPLTTLED